MAHHIPPTRLGPRPIPTVHDGHLFPLALFKSRILCRHDSAVGIYGVLDDTYDAGFRTAVDVYGLEQCLRGAKGRGRGGEGSRGNDVSATSMFLSHSKRWLARDRCAADEGVMLDLEMLVMLINSTLNHKRYAMNDETLYVAPSSKHTDYSQPPLNNFYYGVLNTGRRRYAHPALSGSLPTPWLPQPERERRFGDGAKERRGVVLSLRRKMGKKGRRESVGSDVGAEGRTGVEGDEGAGGGVPDGWASGWDEAQNGSRDGARRGDVWENGQPGRGEEQGGEGGGMIDSRLSNGSGSGSSSTNINPWATSSFDITTAKRKAEGDRGNGGMKISMPSEDNVWGEDSSEGEEEAAVASPVSRLCLSSLFIRRVRCTMAVQAIPTE